MGPGTFRHMYTIPFRRWLDMNENLASVLFDIKLTFPAKPVIAAGEQAGKFLQLDFGNVHIRMALLDDTLRDGLHVLLADPALTCRIEGIIARIRCITVERVGRYVDLLG